MSIQSEITRLSGNISDALTAIANKGVTVPAGSNSDDLSTLIGQIQTGGGGTPAISIVDTADSHGGTVRTVTALDISDSTAVAADVLNSKWFYTAQGVKTQGTATGGGGATQHTIHLEFSDSTDTDIEVDYDDALIGTMITAYQPTGDWLYNSKIVDSAALDSVTWYTRPTVIWETLYDDNMYWNPDNDNNYPYCWVTELGNTQIPVGSNWRVTYNNTQYLCTADANGKIGNPVWGKGIDNGSDAPFVFENMGYGAWTGSLNVPNVDSSYYFKIERQVTV